MVWAMGAPSWFTSPKKAPWSGKKFGDSTMDSRTHAGNSRGYSRVKVLNHVKPLSNPSILGIHVT